MREKGGGTYERFSNAHYYTFAELFSSGDDYLSFRLTFSMFKLSLHARFQFVAVSKRGTREIRLYSATSQDLYEKRLKQQRKTLDRQVCLKFRSRNFG